MSETFHTLEARRVGILREIEAFEEVAEIFLEDTPPLYEELGGALDAGDLSAVAQISHRLKGSAANLGADRLSGLYKELELLAEEGDVALCRAKLEGAKAQFREVGRELAQFLERP